MIEQRAHFSCWTLLGQSTFGSEFLRFCGFGTPSKNKLSLEVSQQGNGPPKKEKHVVFRFGERLTKTCRERNTENREVVLQLLDATGQPLEAPPASRHKSCRCRFQASHRNPGKSYRGWKGGGKGGERGEGAGGAD